MPLDPSATTQPETASAPNPAVAMLTADDRDRIRHETLLRAEIRREVDAAMAAKSGAKPPGLLTRLGSKMAQTTVVALFATLITVLVGLYHDYSARRDNAAKTATEIKRANREKRMNVLAAFPNEIETSHGMLAEMQRKRIWLSTHHSESDTDELGRPRKQVDLEFWEIWKMYSQTKKPYAILTEAKVFFDSPAVIAAADKVNEAMTKEYVATTESELDTYVGQSHVLLEAVTSAMSDELNETTGRPKRSR